MKTKIGRWLKLCIFEKCDDSSFTYGAAGEVGGDPRERDFIEKHEWRNDEVVSLTEDKESEKRQC